MIELVTVQYLQPEARKGLGEHKLDGIYDHPARYVICACWFDHSDSTIQGIWREGRFKVDKKLECDNFLGKFKARIMARNLPREKLMMADHYSPVQAQ